MLVTVLSPRGVESVLHLVAAGGSLDATDNLTQSPTCSVSAETLTDSTIAFIRSETLRQLLDADPRFPAKLLPQIAVQMRRLEARYACRDAEKVSVRLIRVLLDLVCLGDQTGKHAVILPAGLTRLALARIVGTTAETLCRVLGRLQRASVIRLKDRSIEIPDVHRLREALTRKQPRNS
jgi:CRP-like cAMP-binding protein